MNSLFKHMYTDHPRDQIRFMLHDAVYPFGDAITYK